MRWLCSCWACACDSKRSFVWGSCERRDERYELTEEDELEEREEED